MSTPTTPPSTTPPSGDHPGSARPSSGRPSPTGQRMSLAERWRPYRVVLGSRLRSQRSFRANFAIDLAGSSMVGVLELAEVLLLFGAVTSIGGLGLAQALLVYGFCDVSFSLADMVVGHCDNLPDLLREGRLDVYYLRPQPVLLQLVTSDISLRRLARALVGASAFAVGVHLNHLAVTPAHVALVLVALASGTLVFAATFIVAAGIQFFVLNGGELANSVTYGGRYASSQPASVWPRAMTGLFGFAVPVVFCGYLPTLELCGLHSAIWWPAWTAWCAPLAALWMWALALFAWRMGTRHHQGGGG